MIQCPRCSTVYPDTTHFPVDRSRISGHFTYCRTCAVELQLQWRINNPEKHKAIVRRRAERIKKSHEKNGTA